MFDESGGGPNFNNYKKSFKNNDLGDGGPNRSRTDDLLHAMQALYQLSYGPLMFCTYTVKINIGKKKGGYFIRLSSNDSKYIIFS